MIKFKSAILYVALSLSLNLSQNLYAQGFDHNPMVDVHTVIGSTLVGAVLGLSTLSFTSKPGEKWKKHLGYGVSLGIIGGVIAVVHGQAQRSQSVFEKVVDLRKDFPGVERFKWHEEKQNQYIEVPSNPIFLFAHSFRF